MNQNQQSELRTDEGFRTLIYDDATGKPLRQGDTIKGHPTIGYGRCLDLNGVSEPEAAVLLANDIALAERDLGRCGWYAALDDVRKGVLVNLCFNMGFPHLLGFRHMITALTHRDFVTAVAELQDSEWFRKAPAERSGRLCKQLLTGALTNSLIA